MKICDIVKLTEEVIKGDIHGWDSLRGIFEHGKEEDPDYIFNTTYPSVEVRNLLEAIDEKLKGIKKTGFFEIMGGYGTGKSRILCLLYHLFKNPGIGEKWLNDNKISLDLPKGTAVLAFSLMDYPPNYLWEPIFQGLGREDLLKKVTIFPGSSLLKEALADNRVTVIIMDEVESWYRGVRDKDNNLNFLQVLAEVACEERSKLLVFCALYGEVPEILARIDRVGPYRVNLTLSKDRHKIILFRLFEEVNKEAASKVVSTYLKHYHDAEVEILNPPLYERRMAELYPIHPELMDVLLTRYSSSPNYQNTRGVLCLLASVIMKTYRDIDLLLTSNIDMSEGDLLSLDRILVESAQKDSEAVRKDIVRSLLNTILLYSFGEVGGVGASRNDIILGILRPGMNINEIDSALLDLPNIAPHVWIKDNKYVIRHEANIVTLIQNKALETINKGKIKDALDIIKARLKKDSSYLVYHPNKEFGDYIEDADRIRIVVSLKTLNQLEINEFYKGKKFANRLILYIPKSGDLTKNEDLLVIAERLRLCDQYESEVSKENKSLLDKLRDRDSRTLKEKISDTYGYWVRVTGFENGEIKYRLVPCNLDEVRSTVKKSYDVETIRGEVLEHLNGKNNGLRLEDIKYDFKTVPGKPIIVVEALLEEALKSLYEQGEIVIEYKGRWIRKPEHLPSFKDDMKIVLSKYVPPPEELIEKEEAMERRVEKVAVEIPKPSEGFIKSTEIIRKEEEIKAPLRIKTSEYPSPFNLSVEVERKVPNDVQVRGIELEFSGCSFDDFKSFNSFIDALNVRKPKVHDVNLRLIIEGPMSKEEVINLIDKLPRSLGGGSVRAVIEAERVA